MVPPSGSMRRALFCEEIKHLMELSQENDIRSDAGLLSEVGEDSLNLLGREPAWDGRLGSSARRVRQYCGVSTLGSPGVTHDAVNLPGTKFMAG